MQLVDFNLYNPHDPTDPKTPLHPEVSIFDRDVIWKNLTTTDYAHKIMHVNDKQGQSNTHFDLDDHTYEVDLNDIDNIFQTNKPLIELKVTPTEVMNLQEKDEQHGKIIADFKKGKTHPAFLLDDSYLLYRQIPDGKLECQAIFVPQELQPYV